MSTQAFPTLKVDTSMNSSNTTLAGAGPGAGATATGGHNGNSNGSGRRSASKNETNKSSNQKKPPSSNARYISGATAGAGVAGRGRTTSAASDQSIKKDDLLDRLADALKWVFFFSSL
jgi:hypothetical protein